MKAKKIFDEPKLSFSAFASSSVALYTSGSGTEGDVWERFDNEWLNGVD